MPRVAWAAGSPSARRIEREGTHTPVGFGAPGAAFSRKLTRTPMSGTIFASRSFSAMRTFTVALLRSAAGMIAITSAGIFQSG